MKMVVFLVKKFLKSSPGGTPERPVRDELVSDPTKYVFVRKVRNLPVFGIRSPWGILKLGEK